MLGTFALSSGYYEAYYGRARGVLERMRRELDAAFEQADLLVTPDQPDVGASGSARRWTIRWPCTCPTSSPRRRAWWACRRSRSPRGSTTTGCRCRSRSWGGRSTRRRSSAPAGRSSARRRWRRGPDVPRGGGRIADAERNVGWVAVPRLVLAGCCAAASRPPARGRSTPAAPHGPRPARRRRGRALSEEEGIFVEAVPQKGEGLYAFTRRLCGDDEPGAPDRRGQRRHPGAPRRACATASPSISSRTSGSSAPCGPSSPSDKGQADGWRHEVRGVGAAAAREPLAARPLVHRHGGELPRDPRVQRAPGRRRAARRGGGDPLGAAAAGVPRGPAGAREALSPGLRQGRGRASTRSTACGRARRSTRAWWCGSPAASTPRT